MVWFRECWHEEVLRQLRQGLAKCYQVAFETRGDGKLIFLDYSYERLIIETHEKAIGKILLIKLTNQSSSSHLCSSRKARENFVRANYSSKVVHALSCCGQQNCLKIDFV